MNAKVRVVSLIAVLSMMVTACGGGGTTGSSATTAPSGGAGGGAGAGTTMAPTTGAGGGAGAGATMAPTTGAGGGAGAGTTMAPTTGASGGASGGGAMTLPANCQNVQLQYWNPFTGPDGPFMGQLTNKFNTANPNIKVTMTSQADYGTKLATAAAADQLPDVAIINEDQIATQAFNHIIRPMDDVVTQMGVGQADFPAVAWNTGAVAGRRYGVPLSMVPMTMYYNADLLQQAGMSNPPKNADDFAKAAAAVTQGNNHGFIITTGFPAQQIFQQLLHQYGGSEFNQDATKATWNSDAGVKALQWMKDAQTKYGQPKLPVDADLNAFKAGTVGMIWNGIWQTTNVTGEAVDFKGMATASPQIGPQPATWAGAAYLSLPVHKSGTDACKDAAAGMFIRYLLDNSVEWAKAGNIPAYNKARNSAEMKSVEPQASIAPSVENPIFPPPVPGIGDAFAPLGDAVGAVMSGTATDIQATLNSAADRANQILAQNKQKYGDKP